MNNTQDNKYLIDLIGIKTKIKPNQISSHNQVQIQKLMSVCFRIRSHNDKMMNANLH